MFSHMTHDKNMIRLLNKFGIVTSGTTMTTSVVAISSIAYGLIVPYISNCIICEGVVEFFGDKIREDGCH